ncbi:hypothetical protein DL767_005802 [Monosporascus sp. MG133]|nr:hypothetical protein DL767_005802 [Monosporascus sp. MG133]
MVKFPVTNGVTTFREPPEGYVVNFAHPQQQLVLEHYLIFGIGGTLAFLALLQRFYSKVFLYNGLQINDGFMFLAWASSVATQILVAFDFTVEGSCLDAGILYIATAVSNVLTDIILFVLPIPMILGLCMGWGRKIAAIIVFAIGSATVATSIIRLALLPPLLASTDPSWDAAPANIWTFVEANLFIICGSIPTIRAFFKKFAPKVWQYVLSVKAHSSPGQPSSNVAHRRSRNSSHYHGQFREEVNEMMILPSERTLRLEESLGTSLTTVDHEVRADRDDNSDKAILETKSFHSVQCD